MVCEDVIVDVLDRHVNIRNDFFTYGDGFDKSVIDPRRIEVHQPDPFEGDDLLKFIEQGNQAVFYAHVPPVNK